MRSKGGIFEMKKVRNTKRCLNILFAGTAPIILTLLYGIIYLLP